MTKPTSATARELLNEATRVFMAGRASEALEILDSIPHVSADALAISISFTRALILEFGGDGLSPNPRAAEDGFRKVVLSNDHQDATAMRYLARVLMKQGTQKYGEAKRWLDAASAITPSPLLWLGYGHLFETSEFPDLDEAKRYYRKALLRGRFAGGFGLQRILRRQGRIWPARFVMLLHAFFGPIAALLMGRRSRETFHGT